MEQPENSPDTMQLRTILIAREHARADAWIRKDRRALEALLAPEYVETTSLGRFTRREVLERIFPVFTLQNFVMEEPAIHVTGTGAELVYRCRQRFTAGKQRVEGTFLVSATYCRDGNQYRLLKWESRPAG